MSAVVGLGDSRSPEAPQPTRRDAPSSPATGERSSGWDALKGVAIIAVVAIHASFGSARGATATASTVALASLGVAVPAFMVLSALLASREAIAGSARSAILRRVVRLVPLYLTWTCIYVGLSQLTGGLDRANLHRSSIVAIVLFGASWYHMYFLPALIQLLVALPLLLLLVKTPFRARMALAAGILALALDPPLTGASGLGSHNPHHHLVVAAFSSSYVFVWIPAGLAGAALGVGTIALRRPVRWFVVAFVVITFEAFEAVATHAPSSTGYGRAGLLVAAVAAVVAAQRWAAPPRWLVTLGRNSLGVFLVHPLLLWALRPLISSTGLWLLPITVAVVVTGALQLVIVVGRTPVGGLVTGDLTIGRTFRPSWGGSGRGKSVTSPGERTPLAAEGNPR